ARKPLLEQVARHAAGEREGKSHAGPEPPCECEALPPAGDGNTLNQGYPSPILCRCGLPRVALCAYRTMDAALCRGPSVPGQRHQREVDAIVVIPQVEDAR